MVIACMVVLWEAFVAVVVVYFLVRFCLFSVNSFWAGGLLYLETFSS